MRPARVEVSARVDAVGQALWNDPQGAALENYLYRASDDVISSQVGDEIILLHTESDKAYGLDNTAAFVWAMLDDQGKTRDQLLQGVTDHFDVESDQAAQDLDALLAHLAREQLVHFQPTEPELRP